MNFYWLQERFESKLFHFPSVLAAQSLTGGHRVSLAAAERDAEIAGLDNDGRMCGQLTELKLQNFIP